jgi:3-hydroxyacyl-CoA dehydrogenase/3a,7a,12a-trihydroxy-5b-cholest-24-enoyl-CoA hydratase
MPKGEPSRKPDFEIEDKTNPNQAFLYRLCSDKNPLHVDPDRSGGFERPILMGLCTFGFTGRNLWEHFFKNDAMRLSEMGVRFTSHVFPGETLIVQGW